MRRLWPWLALAALAVAVWIPTLFVAQPGDNFGYDLNWSTQFSAAFHAGQLYPRWTPNSFDGLGSPTFYFYPPLAFWTAALVPAASAVMQVKVASLALFAISGWTMFAWLRRSAEVIPALLGAALYLLAPYHLDDHYVRGALAELSAFAVLPIVALGLARTADGARLGPVWLALGWGALIFAHLPIALLTGVFLVGPYGLYLVSTVAGPARALLVVRLVAGLAFGTGLVAIYLVPALGLQDAISADYWWSARFQAADRLFLNPAAWTLPFEPFLAGLTLVEVGVATWIGWRAWREGERGAAFWAMVVVVVAAALAGLFPGLWTLPLMAKVQFPWRAMAVQEFALATLVGLAPGRATAGVPLICVAALIFGNGLALARDLASPQHQMAGVGAASFPTAIDAPEYLPRGMLRITADGPAPVVSFSVLAGQPLVTGAGAAATDAPGGGVHLRVAPGPSRQLIVRRFAFPGWQATCDGRPVPIQPTGPGRLIGLIPPANAQTCDLAIGVTPQEEQGGCLSLVSAALLAAYALWAALSARRERRTSS